jgi:hypothetical protein
MPVCLDLRVLRLNATLCPTSGWPLHLTHLTHLILSRPQCAVDGAMRLITRHASSLIHLEIHEDDSEPPTGEEISEVLDLELAPNLLHLRLPAGSLDD